ncbi:MAG: hypothetical protein ABR591_08085 [Candidatus Velthaea sp.]
MRTLIRSVTAIAIASLLAGLALLGAVAQSGGAQTFTIPVHARRSARAAFREAFGSMRQFEGLQLRSAVADKADRVVQGSFTATVGGVSVTGVLLAGTAGSAVGAYDTSTVLRGRFRRPSRKWARAAAPAAERCVRFTESRSVPDRSRWRPHGT